MKKLCVYLLMLGCGWVAGQGQQYRVLNTIADTTRWIESPVTQRAWQESVTNGWTIESVMRSPSHPEIEIGLRQDGIVIWRTRK